MKNVLCVTAIALPFATYLPAYDGAILGRLFVLYTGTAAALGCLIWRSNDRP